ncbi:hypothetical protein GCM10023188_06680 [Pontibacter saemangeumensis]|uniref:Uncharacterized protein n=1 Tax=Pontibacter saemangeumensis TaxID=1084525 RepID=A0ABP8LAQ7_9BACT
MPAGVVIVQLIADVVDVVIDVLKFVLVCSTPFIKSTIVVATLLAVGATVPLIVAVLTGISDQVVEVALFCVTPS